MGEVRSGSIYGKSIAAVVARKKRGGKTVQKSFSMKKDKEGMLVACEGMVGG